MRDKIDTMKGLLESMDDTSKIDYLRQDFDKIYGSILKQRQREEHLKLKKIKNRKKAKLAKKQKQKNR